MDQVLKETLGRLRGGNIDDNWWRRILNWFEHSYVAPEFLDNPTLKEWLAEEQVAEDFRALAAARIMQASRDDRAIHARLAESYSRCTGEDSRLAEGPLDVVEAVLVTGYLASVPPEQKAIAGMVQQLSSDQDHGFSRIEQLLQGFDDQVTRQAHTEKTERELDRIRVLRTFNPDRARERIQELCRQVAEMGDLRATSDSAKSRVLYWGARLCASNRATVASAKQLRDELRSIDLNRDVTVIDALIAEAEGNLDKALQLLRDRDDPEFRTVFFVVLERSQGVRAALAWCEDLDARHDTQFFTLDGWKCWAIGMAQEDRWEEAAQQLLGFEPSWPQTPALAFVEGVVKAAMLLPDDQRGMALASLPLYLGISPSVGTEADGYHARATTCFKFVDEALKDITDNDTARAISDWRLWLRLMDPDPQRRTGACDEIRGQMEDGTTAVQLISFVHTFQIPVNLEPLKRYLERRKQLGGLVNDDELRAECLVAQQSMRPADFVDYSEQHNERLKKVVPVAMLATMQVCALVEDGHTQRARALVRRRATDLGDAQCKRLTTMIEGKEGKDPREQLERQYRETGSLADLQNLVDHLKERGDRKALAPLAKDLFRQHKTVEHASDVVWSLGGPLSFDHDTIIEFLEANADILAQSDHLKAAKAKALFRAGRYGDARRVNNDLVAARSRREDMDLGIHIAVFSGDWERTAVIIDQEWHTRDTHDAETLIELAKLAAQVSGQSGRVLELAKLAAKKAPDDPKILVAAYGLYFRLGRDDEVDPHWLPHASELSSVEDGPVWRRDVKYLLNDWLPRRHDFLREVGRQWLNGELTTGYAADGFGVPLARLLLNIPQENANRADGRGREILPIVAATRRPVQLQREWTIGLDVSSIMVLCHLGLLETAINAFHQVRLAPDLMELLFEERERVRMAQPSRVKAAREVIRLNDQERLRVADDLPSPPESIAQEVGPELASLLAAARKRNGKVVCNRPIYKVGSLMEQHADTGVYDDLILYTPEFCEVLYRYGKISDADYQRTQQFLGNHPKNAHPDPSTLDTGCPVYVDEGALYRMQWVKVLQPLAHSDLDIRIHPNVLASQNAFINESAWGDELVEKIEEIRHTLRGAVESGKASFLPHTPGADALKLKAPTRMRSTASLLAAAAEYDCLCIDDAYFNNLPGVMEPSERPVSIACVLDVLDYLVSRGEIQDGDRWTARHRLREGGFACIPIGSEELLHWLRKAEVTDSRLVETAELRILRQSTARLQSLGICSREDARLRQHAACKTALVDILTDMSVADEHAAQLCNWVWRRLMGPPAVASGNGADGDGRDQIEEWVVQVLAYLCLPVTIESHEGQARYLRWMEQTVFQPLRPANMEVVEKALAFVCEAISSLENGQEFYGRVFLNGLPVSVRRLVATRHVEFAQLCGVEIRGVFGLEPGQRLLNTDLFAAARQVLATGQKQMLQDLAGNALAVGLDAGDRNVVVEWLGADGVGHRAKIPELSLFSPEGTVRVAALRDIIQRLGPAARDFRSLLRETASRELSDDDASAIFHENANGVAAFQTHMKKAVSLGPSIDIHDLIPQSLSYFESLAGPVPAMEDPEVYFRDVLVPHRKVLLERDLRAGLDICCLGALRDDLTPGQWVASFDDDAVWEALSSIDAEGNPFSLLGALDIAMYRQEDSRFRGFAAEAFERLSDDGFRSPDGTDVYRLLQVFADFVLNRVNLLESGSIRPGYWKRMGTLMHAGVIVRDVIATASSIDIGVFEQWLHGTMTAAGYFAGVVDARTQPMLFFGRMTGYSLRSEILGRLVALKSRHEKQGRELPRSEGLDGALARSNDREELLTLYFPGPLEGHRRPTEHFTTGAGIRPPDEGSDDVNRFLKDLAIVSHVFALDDAELRLARSAVKMMPENRDTSPAEKITCLELASLVAAANRDVALADEIADAMVAVVPRIDLEKECPVMVAILLQAAAARGIHGEWFKWLEERLVRIASCLPSKSPESLNVYGSVLDELCTVLPIHSWFQVRGKSIAASGA